MLEIWKDIPHYETIYQASNLGRIRTCEGKITHTNLHGDRHWKQRILKQKKAFRKLTNKVDYHVELWKNGKHKTLLVSRLVGSTFIKDYLFDKKMTINHIDNDSSNNNANNLEWCSRADNIKKGFETGAYQNSIWVYVKNKKTNETKLFSSMTKASIYIGMNHGYISKHKKGNNKNYSWSVLPF